MEGGTMEGPYVPFSTPPLIPFSRGCQNNEWSHTGVGGVMGGGEYVLYVLCSFHFAFSPTAQARKPIKKALLRMCGNPKKPYCACVETLIKLLVLQTF